MYVIYKSLISARVVIYLFFSQAQLENVEGVKLTNLVPSEFLVYILRQLSRFLRQIYFLIILLLFKKIHVGLLLIGDLLWERV